VYEFTEWRVHALVVLNINPHFSKRLTTATTFRVFWSESGDVVDHVTTCRSRRTNVWSLLLVFDANGTNASHREAHATKMVAMILIMAVNLTKERIPERKCGSSLLVTLAYNSNTMEAVAPDLKR
jgi:hypothetical protein